MGYEFYIDGLLLPVTPSKLQMKIGNQNKTTNLINEGEINILKSPGLTEVSFSMLVPQVKYPFSTYEGGFQPAEVYTEKLKALKKTKRPFHFKVIRSRGNNLLFDTDLLVALEDYTITEDAGNGADLDVSVKLKEYRKYGTKILSIQTVPEDGTVLATVEEIRPTDRQPPASYTVAAGDTLWKICQKQLGNGEKYQEIAKLNGISNPNVILIGQVIKLG